MRLLLTKPPRSARTRPEGGSSTANGFSAVRSVIGRRPCRREPPTLTTPLRVVKVRPRRKVTTRFGFTSRWFGPVPVVSGEIIIEVAVQPARERQPEVGPQAERLGVQRLEDQQVRVVHGQQAERDLELAHFEVGRGIEVRLDRQPVEHIGFPDLDVLAARDVRRVFRQELNEHVAARLALARDPVLQVQFRRVDPDARRDGPCRPCACGRPARR